MPGHIEEDDIPQPCMSLDHNPPMHLHIPSGKKYVHTCSGCGKTTVLRPPMVTW